MITDKPNHFKENDRVWTYDFDRSIQHGTLKHQDTIGMEWYVDYDDGQSNLVLDWGLLYKPKEKGEFET